MCVCGLSFNADSRYSDIIVFHTSNQILSGFSLVDYEITRVTVFSTGARQRQTDGAF